MSTAGWTVWSKDPDDGAKFWMTDLNGSVFAIIGETGSVLERQRYDGYGATTVTTPHGQPKVGSSLGNRTGFQGRTAFAEVGLQYFRARFYDPGTGHFLSSDPKGFVNGPNTYGAFGGDPINRTDPMGTDWYHDNGSGFVLWINDESNRLPGFTHLGATLSLDEGKYLARVGLFASERDFTTFVRQIGANEVFDDVTPKGSKFMLNCIAKQCFIFKARLTKVEPVGARGSVRLPLSKLPEMKCEGR